MTARTADQLPHIVVLGGGFAGLQFCRSLPPDVARITLIDRENHHVFQPLLYQVASAGLSAVDIAQPIRGLFAGRPRFAVIMAEVTAVDLANRRVRHSRGEVAYDYLVVGLGGVTGYFGRDDWARYAPGLKSLDDALHIRRQILSAFEKAETATDPAERAALMTLIIVGGGPTGVEMAGAIAELARKILKRDFDHIDPTRARVMLIEGSDRLLRAFDPALSASARRQLERLGVEVRTGVSVEDIAAGRLTVAGEVIRAETIIWAAGVAASPLGRSLGAEVDRGGRVKVRPDLSLPDHPEVFVCGDMAALVDPNGVAVPGVAPAAMQMGAHAARIIRRELAAGATAPGPREPFVYRDKGTMATIGRSAAVAQLGRWQLRGTLAWLAWLCLHLIFLVGFRNKLAVLLNWIYSYLTYKRGARVITGASGRPPGASA
ncbi:MAG: NAD(P)/FAD-dependent oxidoreductase [Opitutaceae bacterium]|nr:NAD(P)/FAD-dependent oxidoreductase [Opitutaceae bacterium]